MIYQGSVQTAAVARMAELFRDAVIANAPNVIVVHNHRCAARLAVIPRGAILGTT